MLKIGLLFQAWTACCGCQLLDAYGSTTRKDASGCNQRPQLCFGTGTPPLCTSSEFTECTTLLRSRSSAHLRLLNTLLITSPSTTATGRANAKTIVSATCDGLPVQNSVTINPSRQKESTDGKSTRHSCTATKCFDLSTASSCRNTVGHRTSTRFRTCLCQTKAWSTRSSARRDGLCMFLLHLDSPKSSANRCRDKTPSTTLTATNQTTVLSIYDGQTDQSSSTILPDSTATSLGTISKIVSTCAGLEKCNGFRTSLVQQRLEASRKRLESTLQLSPSHSSYADIRMAGRSNLDRMRGGAFALADRVNSSLMTLRLAVTNAYSLLVRSTRVSLACKRASAGATATALFGAPPTAQLPSHVPALVLACNSLTACWVRRRGIGMVSSLSAQSQHFPRLSQIFRVAHDARVACCADH